MWLCSPGSWKKCDQGRLLSLTRSRLWAPCFYQVLERHWFYVPSPETNTRFKDLNPPHSISAGLIWHKWNGRHDSHLRLNFHHPILDTEITKGYLGDKNWTRWMAHKQPSQTLFSRFLVIYSEISFDGYQLQSCLINTINFIIMSDRIKYKLIKSDSLVSHFPLMRNLNYKN